MCVWSTSKCYVNVRCLFKRTWSNNSTSPKTLYTKFQLIISLMKLNYYVYLSSEEMTVRAPLYGAESLTWLLLDSRVSLKTSWKTWLATKSPGGAIITFAQIQVQDDLITIAIGQVQRWCLDQGCRDRTVLHFHIWIELFFQCFQHLKYKTELKQSSIDPLGRTTITAGR